MQRKALVLMLLFATLLLLSGCSTSTPSGKFVTDSDRNIVQSRCIDSDLGKDTSTKGTITATLPDGSKYEDEDRCVFGLLIEQYCSGGLPFSENIRCEKGCENGTCK